MFDYNIPTAYFVTICTEHKQPILSNIVGGDVLDAPQSDDINVAKVELLKCGKIAEKYILQLNDFYEDITVENYVIMPDHIHILLRVLDAEAGGASRFSLRLGHAHVLTVHWTVIHCVRATSLRRPLQSNIRE